MPHQRSTVWQNLTLDSPGDVDWFTFTVGSVLHEESHLIVDSLAATDSIELSLYGLNSAGDLVLIERSTSANTSPNPLKTARYRLRQGDIDLQNGQTYWVRVRSLNNSPTLYDLSLDTVSEAPGGTVSFDMSLTPNIIRRDVILGGPGNDILLGGPGEDWILGGDGNDVLSGGMDGGTSDFLLGQAGDDLFQIIPDAQLIGNNILQNNLTQTDELEGGSGYDRIMFVGGNFDHLGRAVNDHLTVTYNVALNRYEVAALVWDTANQQFATNAAGTEYMLRETAYRTRHIEATWFELGAGDDELHLETGYELPLPGGGTDDTRTFGFAAGDRAAGAVAAAFTINAGDGNDRIFGSPFADVINAGSGSDLVLGFAGDDQISGGSDADTLLGNDSSGDLDLPDQLEVSSNGNAVTNDTVINATWLDLGSQGSIQLTLHDGDRGDWYIVPVPEDNSDLGVDDFSIVFALPDSQEIFEHPGFAEPGFSVFPAVLDPTTQAFYVPTSGTPEAYLLHVRNPRSSSVIASTAPLTNRLGGESLVNITLWLDSQTVPFSLNTISIQPSDSGVILADKLNTAIQQRGLSSTVFADFDERLQRLAITSFNNQQITITGNTASGIHLLGFADAQSNTGSAAPIGSYSIQTTRTFPPADNDGTVVTAQLLEYDLIPPDVTFTAPLPNIDITNGTDSILKALRIEGDHAAAQLANSGTVGDINGDGLTGTILWGPGSAGIYLGGRTADRGVTTLSGSADYIIDLGDFYIPVPGDIDLNDDGRSDLLFYSVSGNGIFRIKAMLSSTISQRHLDAVAAVDVTTFTMTTQSADLDLQWLQFDNDGITDLLVTSRTPTLRNPLNHTDIGYGAVINGAYIVSELNNGTVSHNERVLTFLDDVTEHHATVGATLGSVQYRDEAVFDARVHAVVGDFDADGLDEIALTMPEGWQFELASSEQISVARTYIINPGQAIPATVALGSSDAPARIQTIALRNPGSSQPVLSTSSPLLAADFNADGFDELVLAAHSDAASQFSALIFNGQTISTNSLRDSDDATVRIRAVGKTDVNALSGLTLSSGDLDANGQTDLIFGSTLAAAETGTVHVVYDPFSVQGQLNFGSSWGDARVDSVELIGASFGSRFGTLPSRLTDLTGDGIVDLTIGASRFDGTAAGVEFASGAIMVIPGLQRRLPLPDDAQVTNLGNTSSEGRGTVLDSSDGVLEFSGGDVFQLESGNDEAWFRFTTVGDGAAGNLLRTGPFAWDDPALMLDGVAGDINSNRTDPQSDLPQIQVGNGRIGLIEFDLSNLLEAYDDPTRISDAALRLSGFIEASSGNQAPREIDWLTHVPAGEGFVERVFFSGYTDDFSTELWVTDGTAQGTRRAVDEDAGTDGLAPEHLTALGHRLFFTTTSFGEGESQNAELWLTDGDKSISIPHPTSQFNWVGTTVEYNGAIYFVGQDEEAGDQLWKLTADISGTPALERITIIDDAFGDLTVAQFMPTAAGLFMRRVVSGGPEQLWILSNDVALPVQQFDPPGPGSVDIAENWVAYHNGLMFTVDPGFAAGHELWFSDGTASGTKLVVDPNGSSDGTIGSLAVLDDMVYLIANGGDLWRADTSNGQFERTLVSLPSTVNNSRAVVTDNHYVVAVTDTAVGKIFVFSIDPSGSVTAEAQITGNRVDFVQAADGSVVIASHLDSGGQVMAGRLTLFDPQDGTTTTLSEVTDSDVWPDFTDMQRLSSGITILDGPGDDEFGDLIWFSDLTEAGTTPLLDGASGTSQVQIAVAVRAADKDGIITAADLAAAPVITKTGTLSSTVSTLFSVDLIQNSTDLEAFRDLFERGYRSLVISLGTATGSATINAPTGSTTGLQVTRSPGVTATLLDEQGRVIAEDFGSHDLRNLKAGTYFLGIRNPQPSTQTEALPFSILINPPAVGAAHPASNNDTLHGNDGDDVLLGGPGRDAVYGGSGLDTFVTEVFENRDRLLNELQRDVAAINRTGAAIDAGILRDSRVLINASEPLPEGSVNIVDTLLARIIGSELGVGVVPSSGGGFELAAHVYSSDLASIVSLDTLETPLTSLAGLEYLIGLQTLDLSGSEIFSGGLSRLTPANAGAKGALYLRHLNLDENRLIGLGNLQGLTQLRTLSLAGQNNINPVQNILPLDALRQLTYLNLANNAVINMEDVANLDQLRVLDVAGNSVADLQAAASIFLFDNLSEEFTTTSGFRPVYGLNFSSTANTFGSLYHQLNPRTDSAFHTATWHITKLIPGQTYQVLASWHADESHTADAGYDINGSAYSVNQQRPPADLLHGEHAFGVIGTFVATQDGTAIVQLTGGQNGGIVIADALLVRPVNSPLGQLQRLDVTNNPLNNITLTAVLPRLEESGVLTGYSQNSAPVWINEIGTRAAAAGAGIQIDNLLSRVQDNDSDALTLAITTDHSLVDVDWNGSTLKLNDNGATDRPIAVTVTATDARGRSSTQMFAIAFAGSFIEGTVTDGNNNPLQGTLIYADTNGDANWNNTEPIASTDAAGHYRI